MGVLGKIVGGVAGFMIGGPVGALIGAFAGHKLVDKSVQRARDSGAGRIEGGAASPSLASDQVVFAVGVVALAAKLAKADGVVGKDEVRVLRAVFPPGEIDQESVARIYNEAKRTPDGYEEYAEQLFSTFRWRPTVLVQVLDILFTVAMVDGALKPPEEAFLRNVAGIFRFPPQIFDTVRKRHEFAGARAGAREPSEADNLAILGLGPDASDDEIRRRYRELVRENHPDRLVAQGMAEEFVAQATERLKSINAAYDRLAGQRGF